MTDATIQAAKLAAIQATLDKAAAELATPTWGYRRGEAKIFDLKHGESLPDGWSRRPERGFHPHDVELGIRPEPEPKTEPKAKARNGE